MSVARSEAIEVQVSYRKSREGEQWVVSINVNRSPWKSLYYDTPITVVEALSLAAVEWRISSTEE